MQKDETGRSQEQDMHDKEQQTTAHYCHSGENGTIFPHLFKDCDLLFRKP